MLNEVGARRAALRIWLGRGSVAIVPVGSEWEAGSSSARFGLHNTEVVALDVGHRGPLEVFVRLDHSYAWAVGNL